MTDLRDTARRAQQTLVDFITRNDAETSDDALRSTESAEKVPGEDAITGNPGNSDGTTGQSGETPTETSP
jgi:hypothetical protein